MMNKPFSPVKFIALFCAFAILSGCGAKKLEIKEIAAPPFLQKENYRGRLSTELDTIFVMTMISLRNRYETVAAGERFWLLPEADEEKIVAFYDASLQEKGFEKTEPIEIIYSNAKLYVWKQKGFWNNQIVALSFLELGKGSSETQKTVSFFTAQ